MGGRKRGESGNPERDKHVVDGDRVPGILEGRRIVKTLRFFQRRLTKAQSYNFLIIVDIFSDKKKKNEEHNLAWARSMQD